MSVVVLVPLFLTAALAAQQTAFVVDADGRAIAAVDLDAGSVTTKIPRPFTRVALEADVWSFVFDQLGIHYE